MLRIENLRFSYYGKSIINGIDLDIGTGLTVLLGPNGCGKTTLIRLMCGHLNPESGSCTLDGREIRTIPARSRARRLAYVSQRGYAGGDISVRDSVLLGRYAVAGILRSYTALDISAAENAMARCGVLELADRSVLALSGGELQRVLLAKALAQIYYAPGSAFSALLLDEPVTGLDIKHQLRFMALAKEISAERCVVAVLHDIELAARFAQRIIVIKDGSVFADGSPAEVLTADVLREVWEIDGSVSYISGQPFLRLGGDGL